MACLEASHSAARGDASAATVSKNVFTSAICLHSANFALVASSGAVNRRGPVLPFAALTRSIFSCRKSFACAASSFAWGFAF